MKNKSFFESTLKNLPDLTCSRPRQLDYIDLPFSNPEQMENDNTTIQPSMQTIYIEVDAKTTQTDITYDMQTPHSTITSNKLTFIKQIITHPIDQFSKVALLIAHNSLPNVQPSEPNEDAQKEFILKIEDYMKNMFQDTHNMLTDFCNTNIITCFVHTSPSQIFHVTTKTTLHHQTILQ